MKTNVAVLLAVCVLALGFTFLQTDAEVQTAASRNDADGGAAKPDYLSAELRAAVQNLKSEMAAQPTNPENARSRAMVAWKWLNAYARAGGRVPIDLPLMCGVVLSFQNGYRRPSRLDGLIHDLWLREEQPDAIGKIVSNTGGPFEAFSYQTIEQTYTIGSMQMLPGGGVLLGRHFMSDAPRYQTDDPSAPNYISIRCSNPRARFTVTTNPLSGMHGGFRSATGAPTFQLAGPTLVPGDTITVVYGDKTGGSPGFRVQSYSNDAFPLPLYIDLDAKKRFVSLPISTYRVVGRKEVKLVRALAPSVVKPGERFELAVRSEDQYYNRASGRAPAWQVSLGGKRVGNIAAGDETVGVLKDVSISEPGVHRFTVRSADGGLQCLSNPVRVETDPAHRVYWGETHGHTGFAEGQGTPEAFYEFARDDARLDFLTHSEHDLWMDDHEWQVLIDNVKKYNEEGRFIAFLGYEWTMQAEHGGHHNVIFRTADNRLRVPLQEAPYLSSLYRGLAAQNDMRDVLVIPHAHEPGDWRQSHPQMEHLVEIMSMHGRNEWFGVMYLQHGHRVGFIAASDDHLSHPGLPTPLIRGLADSGGLAAVLAPRKTSDAIFDAMKDLAAYATSGERIILDYRLNGARMGTAIPRPEHCRITGSVHGTAPIDSITVVRSGKEIWTKECLESSSLQTVELQFLSPTRPGIHDSPRGWRQWEGTITVRGGSVAKISTPSLYNPRADVASVREDDSRVVDFKFATRGSEKGVILELDDATADTRIEVSLIANSERYTTPPAFRKPARLAAESFTFRLGDALTGKAKHDIHVEHFVDEVTLRSIDPRGSFDESFDFTDPVKPRQGEYYYVRVRQLDGGSAWSSPVWVGGYGPK